MKHKTVLYASRILRGHEVKSLTEKVQSLLQEGREVEANILMLRHASQNRVTRNEVQTCLPLRKLG